MTNLEADLHERWLPSQEQMRQAEALLPFSEDGHVYTAHILINKRFGFWTTDVEVRPVDGVFLTRAGACYAAYAAAKRAHEALDVPVVGGYAMHFMRDGKCEAAVWDDIMSEFPERISRDEQTVWRLVASDVDELAGRKLTEDELNFVAMCMDNSTVNECVTGAIDQLPDVDES